MRELEKHHHRIDISIRVLGICYDTRHAFPGDREIELEDNNLTEDMMKWHSAINPKTYLNYSCNFLYRENGCE